MSRWIESQGFCLRGCLNINNRRELSDAKRAWAVVAPHHPLLKLKPISKSSSARRLHRLLTGSEADPDVRLIILAPECLHNHGCVRPSLPRPSTKLTRARNILTIPFRKTHPVSLSDALKDYISEKYDQHPDMFTADLDAIDALRTEAVTVQEAHTSGVRKIAAYAAQLAWIGGKFPIDIGVEFAWYPCLGFDTERPVAESNLRFELANVLFNLAALHSQLAFALNRTTAEGLKAASSYFCQAAGVIAYLKEDVVPEMRTAPPDDMDVMTLESLEQLMLAQAQECSWSMAIKNGYKDSLISRLAAKVSDFYDRAAEDGTRSEAVSTQRIHHMSAKHHHFAAAAQYRAACDCLEKRRYGEEVARLKDALVCVNEALKEAKWINKTVQGDLNGLKMRVTEDLKRAEKDNDMIYLQNVPPKSELKILDRASMATAKPPTDISDPSSSLSDHGPLGQPLFTRLVPYSVHIAASIYADRRDRIVNTNVVEELENLTNELRDLLQSLNLPGSLQALERPLGLPPTLTSHADEIRQQDGLHRLRRAMREVDTLKEADVKSYQEGVALLQSEAADDERARMRHGTDRWTRPASQQAGEKLYTQTKEIEGYLKSAGSSDELVKNKLKEVEPVLKTLEGTNRDIEDAVPSSRRVAIPPKLEQEASKLRETLNKVTRTENRRRKKVDALRDRAKADDISKLLDTRVLHSLLTRLRPRAPHRSRPPRARVPNAAHRSRAVRRPLLRPPRRALRRRPRLHQHRACGARRALAATS